MATKDFTFSDIDMNFRAKSNPQGKGDIYKKYDENAIKQSLKNLILTRHYEKPFHPEIGSQVYGLLFEPFSPLLGNMIERAIINTIENFEPRVKLLSVDVLLQPDNNTVGVEIYFKIINTQKPLSVNLTLSRTR
jgi:phage baseplate assembly protein W